MTSARGGAGKSRENLLPKGLRGDSTRGLCATAPWHPRRERIRHPWSGGPRCRRLPRGTPVAATQTSYPMTDDEGRVLWCHVTRKNLPSLRIPR